MCTNLHVNIILYTCVLTLDHPPSCDGKYVLPFGSSNWFNKNKHCIRISSEIMEVS